MNVHALPVFALFGVEFSAPWALAALALPLAIVIAARRVERPRALFTGAFELWQRVGAPRVNSDRERERRVPPPVGLFAAGLVCAVLALAGVRPERAADEEPWRVVVDRTPSMYLANGTVPPRTDTRLALAARTTLRALGAERTANGVLWIDATANPPELVLARELPSEWRVAPRAPRSAPEWSRFDAPGTLWLTDDARSLEPRRASCVASGGSAAPGTIAWRAAARVDWDGTQLVETQDAEHQPVLAAGDGLPRALADIARAWCGARGIVCASHANRDATTPANVVLALRGGASGDHAAPVGRDGWTANARWAAPAPSGDAEGALETWLSAPDGTALVTQGPGRVYAAPGALDALGGDPAAFAVSWSALFDAARLPGHGVVALAERADAGGETVQLRLGRPESPDVARLAARWRGAVAFAALAFTLAALAWTVAASRRPRGARVVA